nr:hypothetical protein CFP56_75264 [Quercus suber]
MGVDPDESLITKVDEKVLHSHRERVAPTPREDDEDARQENIIRNSIAPTIWQNYVQIIGKISKKNGGDPSKEVQWSSVMDDGLVDVFLHQVIIGGRVNGTFTSKTYDDIVKELVEKFHIEINKDESKPTAKKWMTTHIRNYSKMAQLWAKDRAKGDHAETAKDKRARYATSTTIDEIDNLISQNEVSLENFEVEDDQRSPKINVTRSRVSSQDAMSSKSKKRRLAEDDELENVIS